MSIEQNLLNFKSTIPGNVKLVAVSKTKPVEDIMEAYNSGQLIFGENKAQDMAFKYPQLPKDIEWHFIGHLQTNKVKLIAPFVSVIHAVDSLKLIGEINKQAEKNGRIIDCLLQFHIAEEYTKFGLNLEEAEELLNSDIFKTFKNINVTGVMGMATYTDVEEQIRKEFSYLVSIFNKLKETYFNNTDCFSEISMGMSGDYQLAIEEGSTMIRIGTLIFGERNYKKQN